MNAVPFVFIDDWNIISYLGETLSISDDDLENYYGNNLTDSEIKLMAYSYLTSPTQVLQKPIFQNYEF